MDVPLEQTVRPRRMPAWIALLGALLLLVAAPLVLSPFQLNLLGKFLTFAIVAIGARPDLGLRRHAQPGARPLLRPGRLRHGDVPQARSGRRTPAGLHELERPRSVALFWVPFRFPVFAIAMAVLVPMLLAGCSATWSFAAAIQGVYFSIITQALALIAVLLFVGQQPFTGGTNGITNLQTMFGYRLADSSTQTVLYLVTAACLIVMYLVLRRLVSSRFGRLLVAMRDDETRVRFLGYNPVVPKTVVFALSAGIAGLAGALFVPQVGIISPTAMGVVPSIEMVIWVAVGGRGTLIGAIVGALLVNCGKSGFSEMFPEFWQFFLGALCVGTVLFFPLGIVGTLETWRRGARWKEPLAMSNEQLAKPAEQLGAKLD